MTSETDLSRCQTLFAISRAEKAAGVHKQLRPLCQSLSPQRTCLQNKQSQKLTSMGACGRSPCLPHVGQHSFSTSSCLAQQFQQLQIFVNCSPPVFSGVWIVLFLHLLATFHYLTSESVVFQSTHVAHPPWPISSQDFFHFDYSSSFPDFFIVICLSPGDSHYSPQPLLNPSNADDYFII